MFLVAFNISRLINESKEEDEAGPEDSVGGDGAEEAVEASIPRFW